VYADKNVKKTNFWHYGTVTQESITCKLKEKHCQTEFLQTAEKKSVYLKHQYKYLYLGLKYATNVKYSKSVNTQIKPRFQLVFSHAHPLLVQRP